jgi:Tol biopolymer transport system component
MVAVAMLVLLVALVDPTEAAVPGKNGNIVFTSNRNGNGEIYVMNSDSTGLQGLINNPASELNPDFSPNGGKIAFASSATATTVRSTPRSWTARGSRGSPAQRRPTYSPTGSRSLREVVGDWEEVLPALSITLIQG